jgi:hypothetical protein
MYRTRQQFPSFMGVYIPPCSNVQSSINVCVCNVTTVCTTEVFAVPNTNVTAIMTSLRSISRRNGCNLNAINLALVFKERTELIEVPGVTSPSERLVAFLGVHTPSDILQVLNGNTFVFFLCFRYNLPAYAVIDNSGKSSLTSFQPFQQLMTVASAFGLNRSSHFVVSVSYVLDLIRGNVSTVRDGYNVRNAHIDTDKVLCVLLLLIGNIYRLVEVELSFDKNKVSFAFRILHELWTVASICYLLTTTNKRNGTDGFFGIIGKNAAIISDSSELSKMSLLLSIKFVCVGNLTDCTHDKLGGKTICFFNRIIDFLMQAELLENMTFPRYLRDSVASLIENAESIFQCYSLFVSWKQFNLQSQFHTTKIQKSFELFKCLKEIIILSSLKDGIVAQFLPKAKDFWVSMSQVI